MTDNVFNSMELDAIGEVMNISLGSSATVISNMLNHRVEITTPKVTVTDVKDFSLGDLQPAVGVEIRYVAGLEGSNIMLLKRSDVKVIVDILMGTETPDEEFELNELNISAICEVMNQMMGAASTALSDFLGRPVNISTPESFELDDFETFKKEHFPKEGKCAVVRFTLKIEDVLESEFINVMSVELARELLAGLGVSDGETGAQTAQPAAESPADGNRTLSQAEIERLMGSAQSQPAAPEKGPEPGGGGKLSQEEIERLMGSVQSQPAAPEKSSEPGGGGKLSQAEIERLMGSMQGQPAPQAQNLPPQGQGLPPQSPAQPEAPFGGQPAPQPGPYPYPYPPYGQYMPGYYPPPAYYPPAPPEPKKIDAKTVEMPHLAGGEPLTQQQGENLDLLMSVPLEVSVEIGRTHKKVQDILAFSKGSLVVLNKLAGDQVDLFVNGQCVAKGDVVVVDDNFGVRITEILKAPDPGELIRG